MHFELTPQQRRVQSLARTFAVEEIAPHARQWDESNEMPPAIIQRMAEIGLLGGPLPERYGGMNWDHLSLALAYEELGRADSSVRGFMTVHTSLVALGLLDFAPENLKDAYLPALISGEAVGCFCLTEPEAGSDAASLQTRVSTTDSGFALDGEKTWITNGGIADIALVFATHDPEQRHQGIQAFLVPGDTDGFIREKMPGQELGHRASDHARIQFTDCRIAQDHAIGNRGEGFESAMKSLDHGRLGVAAGALGVAQACLDACIDFSKERRQFGRRIGDFQMIQSVIADMAADVEAARLLVYKAAWIKDQGLDSHQATSIAKLFATEAAVRAADQAVLLHGGRGYSNEYPVERYYRDIKGLQIYEGTSHIQRIVIARKLLGKA